MLQVTLAFLYMGITCYILGFGILTFLTEREILSLRIRKGKIPRDGRYHIRHRLSYLLAGVVAAGVYAQLFSLFGGVGLIADLGLAVICVGILWFGRDRILDHLMARAGYAEKRSLLRTLPDGNLFGHRLWVWYILLFLVIAYGTSHGIMHYDTGLYHAQSIRFVEEYGVVRGLANLHSRLGYNSAAFPLTALFSFSYLGEGSSLHVTSGFFALLLSYSCLDIMHILRRGTPVLTDYVRFAGLYYLFNIYKEMVSPASDYALNCLLFCLLILWVELDVRRERHYLPYALIICGIVFAITIKLSAVALLLLAVKPIIRIIRTRRSAGQAAGAIALFVLLGSCVAAPWFLRNAMISGWLLYPSTAIGIHGAVWQLPHDLAEGDAAGIRAYARGTDGTLFEGTEPDFAEWLPAWFAAQSAVSRILLILDLAALIAYLIYVIVWGIMILRRYRNKENEAVSMIRSLSAYSLLRNGDFLFLEGVLLISFLFWFTQSPLIRYGFFFVWTPPVLIAGRMLCLILHRAGERFSYSITRGLAVLLIGFLIYKGARLIMMDTSLMQPRYLLTQQEYERFEVIPYEIDGITFYMPASGDRTGYEGYPGGPYRAEIRLLGHDLREGLRYEPGD